MFPPVTVRLIPSHFAHAVNERMPLAAPKRAWGDIFQPEFLVVICKDLRTLPQALSVLPEILQIGELVATRHDVGADPPNACLFEHRRSGWKFLEISIEGGRILVEFHGQPGRAKLQISFLQIFEKMMEIGVVERRQIASVGLDPFEAML